MPTREELHRLIDSLPDDAIPAAHMALTDFQTWPPPIPPELQQRTDAMERRLRERAEMLREEHPYSSGGGNGLMTFSTAPGIHIRARDSFSYTDGGEDVQESKIIHDGSEFTLIERIRRDTTAHIISFTIELTGPDGTTARHEHHYDLR
jgi:hypothetical protein